jgi:chaperonin GroEL
MTEKLVKNLNFGDNAQDKILSGIDKLTKAVSSTLGANGKCVILEDNLGKPTITKDGITVAESVLLLDPVENMGAMLIKEAARKTVKEAGDGTTTATVLAHSILHIAKEAKINNVRFLKAGIDSAVTKTIKYLDDISIPVVDDMVEQVATISANNDKELGEKISKAFLAVGKTGVVAMEESETAETHIEIVDGIQYDRGLKNMSFVTDQGGKKAELNKPLILIVESEIENIRKIQSVLEHVIKTNRALLIIGDADTKVLAALAMNKIKGNIKINIIDAPNFGVTKKQVLNDIAMMTGATVINEHLGDDLDLIQPEHLGECLKSVTTEYETIIQVAGVSPQVEDLIEQVKKDILKETKPGPITRLERRLALLSAKIANVKVGANSDVELKEKKDRVEDAVCATKAAIKEGIVPGGGIALLNAAQKIKATDKAEQVLFDAIKSPFKVILSNAGIESNTKLKEGDGINVVTGNMVNMINSGIIDPLLVTKSALKNAASVATTILSTDCVINNIRMHEGDRR